jgi:hypothetical protein
MMLCIGILLHDNNIIWIDIPKIYSHIGINIDANEEQTAIAENPHLNHPL